MHSTKQKGKIMRFTIILFTISLLALPLAAQEQPRGITNATKSAEPTESYVVQLTEFRLKSSLDPKLTASEIVEQFAKLKDDETIQPVETIRMSTLGGTESMVQFARQATVTVGTSVSGRGARVRQTQTQRIGTMVRLTATPQSGKVLVKLSYESSRFDGKGTEDSPPDTVTTLMNSSHLVELGKPKLIAGTSEGSTSFLLLTVSH